MLRISQAQLDALEAPRIERAAQEIGAWLKAAHPLAVRGLDDAELEARVEASVRTARRYGLNRLLDIRQFVTLMFLIAPDFHRRRAFTAVLTDRELTADHRIDALLCRIPEAEWDAARTQGRADGWRLLGRHV